MEIFLNILAVLFLIIGVIGLIAPKIYDEKTMGEYLFFGLVTLLTGCYLVFM